jgi:hypothetical protein
MSDLTFPGAGIAGLVLGLATAQIDLDLSMGIYPLLAALVGLLWRLNSRMITLETKFSLLEARLMAPPER